MNSNTVTQALLQSAIKIEELKLEKIEKLIIRGEERYRRSQPSEKRIKDLGKLWDELFSSEDSIELPDDHLEKIIERLKAIAAKK